ncbi:bifunctional serine/threonine-protein kinase/ABC transporter substrate-binding protein [Streptomyces avicenniae]|uniref:bifunctional serine/threonine-protein kinase/ABC transporter substrate-binding protein n=1 Tax=Streptomyces avicenniae TaxID=500153 RepID=UPI00069C6F51|nr:bifunctional serine/threonine-protein kinase/ABC transporter substrate-binding protein [Streptomyces avicenniae]
MKDLEPSYPRRIGAYRLLGQLAEGRTGVVHLARAQDDAPVALKVIRPEHVRAPGFRPRFERDVAAARHVRHPHLVTVMAADTAGRTIWAAYPYLPGPTLPRAVATRGPLPVRSTRILGAALAQALRAVHAAGLAHRDVRPGHIILATDGPRLTGFGGSGTVPSGPGTDAARDILGLGHVLAVAAAGRPAPTGGETCEPPDLADVPRALREIVQACLAADPVVRPTAADLCAELAERRRFGWLPAPLAQDVADRYAAPLPDPEGAASDADVTPEVPPGAGPLPRRRAGALIGVAAVALAAAGTAALTRRRGGGAPGEHYTIGLQADLSGPHSVFGTGQRHGVTLAVEELALLRTLPFTVTARTVDDGGDPQRGALLARELAADTSVMAVIGPTTDDVAGAVTALYARARLPLLALSPGGFEPGRGHDTVLRGRPGSAQAGRAVARLIGAELGAGRVGLVEPAESGRSGGPRTDVVRAALGEHRITVLPTVRVPASGALGPAAAWLVAKHADTVLHVGPARSAGRLAAALRKAGFTGVGLATQEALAPPFFAEAGDAAEGWHFVTPYSDPTADPAGKGFTAAHEGRFGARPDPYAVEAYDAVRFLTDAMARLRGRGPLTRDALVAGLRHAARWGIGRQLAFDAAGNYTGTGPAVYLYQVTAEGLAYRSSGV